MIVALVEPEIPYNTGNIARLCAATKTPLLLAGQLGFSLDDRYLKRAGLDYWKDVNLIRIPLLEDFWEWITTKKFALLSKKAERIYTEINFSDDMVLVFGSETMGIEEKILKNHWDITFKIPMWGNVRSLNLSSAVSIVLYEGYRQLGYF